MFFRFAKNNCCNYSSSGPFDKSHYCWEIGGKCYLHPDIDMGCFHFVNNVLPLDKELEAKWLEANPPLVEQKKFSIAKNTNGPKVKPEITGFGTCACGNKYPIKSNRQTRCSDCQRAFRKKSKKVQPSI
jgi:hypothetical protein